MEEMVASKGGVMNFRAILIRFLLSAVVIGALAGCQQEPDSEIQKVIVSSIAITSEPKQPPQTVARPRQQQKKTAPARM